MIADVQSSSSLCFCAAFPKSSERSIHALPLINCIPTAQKTDRFDQELLQWSFKWHIHLIWGVRQRTKNYALESSDVV